MMKKFTNKGRTRIDDINLDLSREPKIIAIGNAKLIGNWNKANINIDLIQDMIKIVKILDADKKSISIYVAKDMPICFGEDKENIFSGVIIAPRIEEEE